MPCNKKETVIFYGLICLFLLFRLAVLFSSLDKMYEPEELYRGTIAKEVIQGPLIPLWNYLDFKVEYFPGGVLTVGILAVPFFLLFGQTYITLKLVGLLFALGTFILWYFFLAKFFNKKTANICALLFIFCMPFYTKTSLITWGAHPEANFFTILSILIFYKIFFGKDKETASLNADTRKSNADLRRCSNLRLSACNLRESALKMKYFFLLGLVSGFGLWFVQTYLLTLGVILLFWLVFDARMFLRREFYIFGIGFIIGFSPGLYYELFYKVGIFNINGRPLFLDFILADINQAPQRLLSFLALDLPRSFLFAPTVISYLYYLCFLFAFSCLLWVNKKPIFIFLKKIAYPITLKPITVTPRSISKETFILVFPLIFCLGYVFSGYSVSPLPWDNPEAWLDYIGYRYMIPIIPFILAIMAVFLGRIRTNRITFRVFILIVLILGLAGNLNLISLNNFGKFFQDKGYSYNIIGDKIGLRFNGDLKEEIEPFERLDNDLKIQFYEGLGAGVGWRFRDKDISETVKIFDTEVASQYRLYCYKGWGMLFFPQDNEEFAQALYVIANISPEYRPFVYEGMGRNVDFSESRERIMEFLKHIGSKIREEYQEAFYFGLGYGIGFEFKPDPVKQLDLLELVSPGWRPVTRKGIALGINQRSIL